MPYCYRTETGQYEYAPDVGPTAGAGPTDVGALMAAGLLPAAAGGAPPAPATLPAGFNYSAAGVTYQGQTVVSWWQLALGLFMLGRS